jgi:hypothetical protein
MINIPIKIVLPEIWQGEFEKDNWNPINYIVGANGTGKSLFSEKLRQQLQIKKDLNGTNTKPLLKTRLLTADRLSGFEKGNFELYSDSYLRQGLDISYFGDYKDEGEKHGLSTSAFITLKERLDVRIKIEALLSDFFKKIIRLVEEGGFLKPKMQNISGGTEYTIREQECHGFKEIITLLTFLYDDEYQCIIFDEPELHLHPQFQCFFLNEIRKLSGNPIEYPSKKIFFIITHSPYFLDLHSFDDLKSIIVCHNNRMPTYIKDSDLDTQDKYVLSRFLPRFNTYHKQFFFSKNPVFVEGYTDQQIATLLFEKIGLNISASGSSIIDVGGKDELAVFFKLSNKLGIDCRIIADYDAVFQGKLREVLQNDHRVKTFFQQNGLGTDITNAIGELERKIKDIANNIITKSTTNGDIMQLISHLQSVINNSEKRHEVIYSVYLALIRYKDEIKSLVDVDKKNIIDYIEPRFEKICESFEKSNCFILKQGELEHYFRNTTVNYLNIINKDTLFHNEREYILGLDKNQIEIDYANLLSILKKSIPYVNVDMRKHLRFIIVEWIQNVQNAIVRGEVKDISTLKNNARVNYKLYSQIFDCVENNFSLKADGTFSCMIKIKSSVIGKEKEVLFDHTTTPQNFEFEY